MYNYLFFYFILTGYNIYKSSVYTQDDVSLIPHPATSCFSSHLISDLIGQSTGVLDKVCLNGILDFKWVLRIRQNNS